MNKKRIHSKSCPNPLWSRSKLKSKRFKADSEEHSGKDSDIEIIPNEPDCVLSISDVDLSADENADSMVISLGNFPKSPEENSKYVQLKISEETIRKLKRKLANALAEIEDLAECEKKDQEEMKELKARNYIAEYQQREFARCNRTLRQEVHTLEKENKALNKRNTELEVFVDKVVCGVCFQRMRTVAFRGCNHIWFCAHCYATHHATGVGTGCPICRSNHGVNHVRFS